MISIIIPTTNEATRLPRTLAAIAGLGVSTYEIVVVDAGSSDATAAVALAGGARVIASPLRQRAAQMNLGAEEARGEILLFLHGDTLLPRAALTLIRDALADARVVGGAFARRYDSNSWLLRFTCALAYWRGRVSGWFLGDQAIFVRAETFRALGGYRNFPLFEDLDLSRRIRRAGRTVILRPAVLSAARRFAQLGPMRTTWHDLLLTRRYLRGESPQDLARPLPIIARPTKSAYEVT